MEWFLKAANNGLPEAMNRMAVMWSRGLGVAADPDVALEWLKMAAGQGLPIAMYNLGIEYFNRDNKDASVEMIQKAINTQDIEVSEYLGKLLYDGNYYGGKNLEGAFQLFYHAATDEKEPRGNAMHYLSLCYRFGHGTAKDLQQADYWEKKAQETGSDEADAMRNILTNNKNNMR